MAMPLCTRDDGLIRGTSKSVSQSKSSRPTIILAAVQLNVCSAVSVDSGASASIRRRTKFDTSRCCSCRGSRRKPLHNKGCTL